MADFVGTCGPGYATFEEAYAETSRLKQHISTLKAKLDQERKVRVELVEALVVAGVQRSLLWHKYLVHDKDLEAGEKAVEMAFAAANALDVTLDKVEEGE